MDVTPALPVPLVASAAASPDGGTAAPGFASLLAALVAPPADAGTVAAVAADAPEAPSPTVGVIMPVLAEPARQVLQRPTPDALQPADESDEDADGLDVALTMPAPLVQQAAPPPSPDPGQTGTTRDGMTAIGPATAAPSVPEAPGKRGSVAAPQAGDASGPHEAEGAAPAGNRPPAQEATPLLAAAPSPGAAAPAPYGPDEAATAAARPAAPSLPPAPTTAPWTAQAEAASDAPAGPQAATPPVPASASPSPPSAMAAPPISQEPLALAPAEARTPAAPPPQAPLRPAAPARIPSTGSGRDEEGSVPAASALPREAAPLPPAAPPPPTPDPAPATGAPAAAPFAEARPTAPDLPAPAPTEAPRENAGVAAASPPPPAADPGAATPPARPATPVPWPARQVAPFAVALALGPDSSLELTLEPGELGRVEVAIERSGGEAHVSLRAERPETLALLQRDRAELERALADAGLAGEGRGASLSFGLGGEGAPGRERRGTKPQPAAAPVPRDTPAPAHHAAPRSLIDLAL